MKRLLQAPNLALATLWADMLRQGGFDVSVQRAFNSSIASLKKFRMKLGQGIAGCVAARGEAVIANDIDYAARSTS